MRSVTYVDLQCSNLILLIHDFRGFAVKFAAAKVDNIRTKYVHLIPTRMTENALKYIFDLNRMYRMTL